MKFKILNSTNLKIIAMITMTIDHIGYLLLPQYLVLRILGRLSFPIFCFLLVNGFKHTKNYNQYVLRLLVFAVLSEIPFDLFAYGKIVDFSGQNIFFTLLIGLLMIKCIQFIRIFKITEFGFFNVIFEGLVVITACMTAFTIRSDYSYCGILMIYWFYLFQKNNIMLFTFQAFTNMRLMGGVQSFAILGLIPVYLYNGKRGWYKIKYIFYGYYPVHLLILYCISKLI